jgi:hypothetical protein
MAIFRNEHAECQCIDDETNHRIFWMDPEMPGRVYVYLSVAGCTSGEYSNVTVQNNTITGPGASLTTSTSQGGTAINNSFTNGGHLTIR